MVVLQHLLEMERGAQEIDETTLSNGDVYIGNFRRAFPHGKGKYVWLDGTVYEGDWEEGKMAGRGQIIWSSGAKYKGDFSGGYFHGNGTLVGVDGTEFTGTWRMNIPHGLGRKLYSNSDVYEGSWKEGVRDGCGTFYWSSGNSYIGNWKGGKMSGRGVMKWANGDAYDGFWLNGLRNGSGVYKFSDGGYYFGTWSMGIKDGKGTFYPAGTKHPSLRRWYSSLGFDGKGKDLLTQPVRRSMSEKISIGGSLDENGSSGNSRREFIFREPSHVLYCTSDEEEEDETQDSPVYEREYVQGVLTKESVRNAEPSRKTKQRSKSHLKEERKTSIVDIFERRRGYYLMLNLQLGIRYTVGKITPVPMREVRASDFGDRARISMYFPRRGSQFTPPHYSLDFYWKDYCPMVFRNLREMFKLDAAEYMMSICGDDGLSEISSPGKSGSIFYLSLDDRFIIKTLKKPELKCILKMLPQYYDHVKQHENTLITKFFGIHRITLRGRRKVRFVVMGNMFCTELKIHRRYDLKGSTLGRYTEKSKIEENTTLKDLDLGYEFRMDKSLRKSLLKQLSLDCAFLESQQIIDYSLLLGLHFRAPEELKAVFRLPSTTLSHQNLPADDGVNSRGELLIPPKSLLLAIHEPKFVSTGPGTHIRGKTLKAYSLGEKEVDLLLPGTGRLPVKLGVNMPAQAKHRVPLNGADSTEIELFEVYDVVLYFGIIDILQEYNMRKKVEHAYKSLQFDPQSISVVDPKLYARRFLSFLEKIFLEVP